MQPAAPPLDAILRRPDTWRGNRCAAGPADSHSTGYPALDAVLPGGGWPAGALTEIFAERQGIGELQLLMPAAARFALDRRLAIVSPPCIPYPPALAACGINLRQVLLLHPQSPSERIWASEQLLASGLCGAVLMWPDPVKAIILRRLQQAAGRGRTVAVAYRSSEAQACSFAALRLRLEKAPGATGQTAVHVIKRRGSRLQHPVCLDLQQPLSRRPSTSQVGHVAASPAAQPAAH